MLRTVTIVRATAGALATALLVTGCGASEPGQASSGATFPLRFENCREQVSIAKPPERVVLLGPESVPLLAASGGLDKVVARAGDFPFAIYPDEYRSAVEAIPTVGGAANNQGTAQVTLEAVIAQTPDLVIGYEPSGSSVTRAGLAAAGIPMMVIPSYCAKPNEAVVADPGFDDVYAQLELYGRIFGTGDRARAAASTARGTVESIQPPRTVAGERTAAALFIPLGGGAISAYGNPSMPDAQMEAVGLRNVFHDVEKRVFDVSIEEVLSRDPRTLVLVYVDGTEEQIRVALRSYPGVDSLAAVRANNILVLPFEYTDPPTPLSVEGLVRLAKYTGNQ